MLWKVLRSLSPSAGQTVVWQGPTLYGRLQTARDGQDAGDEMIGSGLGLRCVWLAPRYATQAHIPPNRPNNGIHGPTVLNLTASSLYMWDHLLQCEEGEVITGFSWETWKVGLTLIDLGKASWYVTGLTLLVILNGPTNLGASFLDSTFKRKSLAESQTLCPVLKDGISLLLLSACFL